MTTRSGGATDEDDLLLNLAERHEEEPRAMLELGQHADELARLLLRRPRQDRVAVKVHEEHAAAAAHQPPRRHRRVDAAREQARDAAADADRQAAGAGVLAEKVERLVRQRFDMNGQLGVVEIDLPAARFLDPPADLALDLRRGQGKPLVGPAHRDAKRPRVLRAEIAQDLGGDGVDIERCPSRAREVAGAKDLGQPIAHASPVGAVSRARPRPVPWSARTCRTSRSAVASRILRTSRDTNHGRLLPLSAISE